jgi:hypothetical protein
MMPVDQGIVSLQRSRLHLLAAGAVFMAGVGQHTGARQTTTDDVRSQQERIESHVLFNT